MAQSSAAEAIGPVPNSRTMRPIDLVHLAKQCLGDEHLEYEVLRLFDTTIKTYFARLSAAGTDDEVRLNLHSLKGAASGVGAWTIAEAAKAAEIELREAGAVTPETIADIGVAVEEASGFIVGMLSREPS